MMRLPLAGVVALLWMAWSPVARADVHCTANATDMDFGRPVNLAQAVETVSRLEVTCRNGNRDPATTVRVCVALHDGFAPVMTQWFGFARIDYGIYRDAAHRESILPPAYLPVVLQLGPGAASGTAAVHLYGQVPAQDYWWPGTHSQYVTATASWSTLPGACGTATDEDSLTFGFTAKIRLDGSCQVDTGDLYFGQHSDLQADGPISVTGGIDVACSPDTSYQVHIGGGLSGNIADRRMTGHGQSVRYQLYIGSSNRVWGDGRVGGEVSGRGTGLGSPAHYVVRGVVPQQPTPSAGRYSDTVLVTVEY